MRPTNSVSVSSMVLSAVRRRPNSPSAFEENSLLKSPAATVSAIRMASCKGATMRRRRLIQDQAQEMQTQAPSASSHQRERSTSAIKLCDCCAVSDPALSTSSTSDIADQAIPIKARTKTLMLTNAITSRLLTVILIPLPCPAERRVMY